MFKYTYKYTLQWEVGQQANQHLTSTAHCGQAIPVKDSAKLTVLLQVEQLFSKENSFIPYEKIAQITFQIWNP